MIKLRHGFLYTVHPGNTFSILLDNKLKRIFVFDSHSHQVGIEKFGAQFINVESIDSELR